MFLKYVKPYFSYKNLSIQSRLTLLYSSAAFILLTIISLLLYWETINILYKADYQFLTDEVDTIQYLLEDKNARVAEIDNAVVGLPAETDHTIYRYYVRLIDEQNELIIETPNFHSILPIMKSLNHSTQHLGKKNFKWYTKNGSRYLLIQAPVKLRNRKTGLVEIALDISYQHALISDRKILILAIFSSAIASLLLGIIISRRGLRSLMVLTETVHNITDSSLNQRIDPKSWPKELLKLGDAFNQMLERIEASFIRLKQFSADLAHETRIPIHNLIGQTEIALSRIQTSKDYQLVLSSNLEELQRISQLIENILFLARAENPTLQIPKSQIEVHKEIAIVCEYYQAMAEEKGIQLIQSGAGLLNANSIMFKRMISNLLSNALKYTPHNGVISFHTEIKDAKTLTININDTGIGIPQDHLPKIFDRFHRVDSDRCQDTGGVGLGLAIVKSIIDLHKGIVTVTVNLASALNLLSTSPFKLNF